MISVVFEVSEASDFDVVAITENMLLWNNWHHGQRGLRPPLWPLLVKVIINSRHVPHVLTTMRILRLLTRGLLMKPVYNANKY